MRITLQAGGDSWLGSAVDAADGTVKLVLNPWDGSYGDTALTRSFPAFTGTLTGVMRQIELSRVVQSATFGAGQSPVAISGTALGLIPQASGVVNGGVMFTNWLDQAFTCEAGQTKVFLQPST